MMNIETTKLLNVKENIFLNKNQVPSEQLSFQKQVNLENKSLSFENENRKNSS